MNKINTLFLTKKWPWQVLASLCLLLGVAILLRKKPGCADIAVINDNLSSLAYAMDNCCRCDYEPGTGVIGHRNPGLPELDDQEIITEEEIEERLDNVGGEADGKMTISLAWSTKDDLDLHVFEPSGRRIYYNDRTSPSGGRLDVDANGPTSVLSRTPVENVFWEAPQPGEYRVSIVSYHLNESRNGSRLPATMRIVNNGVTEMRELNLVARQPQSNKPGIEVDSFSVTYQ